MIFLYQSCDFWKDRMMQMVVKKLKQGEFFTRKAVEYPKESQVYVRGAYDREQKRYECTRFDDVSRAVYLKGDTEVYTDFVF